MEKTIARHTSLHQPKGGVVMGKRTFAVIVVLVASLWAHTPADAAFNELRATYYSDYFVTEIGWEHSWCDDSYDSDGAQAGTYVLNERWSCATGNYSKRCYYVVNGNPSEIPCP